MDGSKSVESNEQTQPMFLGLFAPSAGWRRWEKRGGNLNVLATVLPSGFVASFHLTGLTATKNGLRQTACQKAKPSDNGMPNKWEQMASIYLKRSLAKPPHHDTRSPHGSNISEVWAQQYYATEEPVQWRTEEDLVPSALLIHSPYDVDARFSTKRDILWAGYKVHLTGLR